jgi:hypothetical protein
MGLQIFKFNDNGIANENGGIYGPFQQTARGLMFLGYTTPSTDSSDPQLNNTQIRVHPGIKPTILTGNAGFYPALAADGIPLTAGQYFRLSKNETQWYFSILPQGVAQVRTFLFAVLPDECFEAGTLNLNTPPVSFNSAPVGVSSTGTKDLVSKTPVTLRGWSVLNEDTVNPAYVQLFDTNDPASVTLGTTTPDFVIPLPPGAGANVVGSVRDFINGIVAAVTTTPDGNVAGGPVTYNLLV